MKVFTTSLLPYPRSIPGFANEQSYSKIQDEEDGEFCFGEWTSASVSKVSGASVAGALHRLLIGVHVG